VRQLDQTHTFEIATPRGGVLLLQPGSYEIDSGSEDQPARIAVFQGAARFAGNGVDTEIKSGEVAVLNGSNPIAASIERAVAMPLSSGAAHVITTKSGSPHLISFLRT
jgi:hypothetical protein